LAALEAEQRGGPDLAALAAAAEAAQAAVSEAQDAATAAEAAHAQARSAVEAALAPLGLLADEVPRQRAALRDTAHRPWPLPSRPWLMGQTWYDLLFAHWAVAPEVLRPLVPPPLELDVRDGRAWLGVTPFRVGGLRSRGTPPLPWLSCFPELNVRTYVDFGGRPGIYFFSLDAARVAAVVAARRGYRLPYFHAEMTIDHENSKVSYASTRIASSGPPAQFRARYAPSGPRLEPEGESLERWLAAQPAAAERRL